jgi:hypothetical protein
VAAGFTTCVLEADFTSPAYSNTATYIDACGSTASPNWYLRFASDLSQPPCNRANITTDGGAQVLTLHFPASDYVAPQNAVVLSYFAPFTAAGNNFPINLYTSITFRIAAGGLTQGSQVNIFGIFSEIGPSHPSWWEPDMFEVLSDTFVSGSGWTWGDGSLDWCNGTICNSLPTDPPDHADLTQYHKIDTLLTSNGSSIVEKCSWIDGTFLGCNGLSLFSSAEYTIHDYTIPIFAGGVLPNQPITTNVDVYIKSFSIWECASWQTTACSGTVVDRWPFP